MRGAGELGCAGLQLPAFEQHHCGYVIKTTLLILFRLTYCALSGLMVSSFL